MKKTKLTSVGVREAKAKLSELLRKVKSGGTVEITERGRTVARIIPVRPPKDDFDRCVDNLLAKGHISTRPTRGPMKLPPPIKLPPGVDLLKMLREDRDAR